MISKIFKTIAINIVVCFMLSSSFAQEANTVSFEIVDDPRKHTIDFLNDIAENGTAPLREAFARFGVTGAQINGVITVVDTVLASNEEKTIKILEHHDTAGVFQQVYAYTHLGKNGFFFWRIDYYKVSSGWAVTKISFNDNHEAVMSRTFKSSTLVE